MVAAVNNGGGGNSYMCSPHAAGTKGLRVVTRLFLPITKEGLGAPPFHF